jgi:hypothetical protein
MDERGMKNAMRLLAVEHVLSVMLATECVRTDDPLGYAEKLKQNFVRTAQASAFPGLDDPAMSDLASAELEAALDRLLSMTIEKVKFQQQRG